MRQADRRNRPLGARPPRRARAPRPRQRRPDLRRIGPDEIAEIEPHATGVDALHSPHTGIVDFAAVARSYAREIEDQGAEIVTGAGVSAIARNGTAARLTHTRGQTAARHVIACAGAWSDRLAVAAGASPDPRIVPFRGSYLRLRPDRRSLVKGLIYPVADPALPFLGVHLTKRIDGEILLGPTALLAPARDAYKLTTVRAGTCARRSAGRGRGRSCAASGASVSTSCTWPPAAARSSRPARVTCPG